MSSISVSATWPRQFKELAKKGITKVNDGTGHQDGWGIVYYDQGTALYLGRETTSAWTDQKYDIAIRQLDSGLMKTKILVAHVRRVSDGSPKTLENTHPFKYKNWTFCHNGTMYDFKPPLQLELEGTTDSETLFKYLLPSLLHNLDKPQQDCIKDSIIDAKKFMRNYTAMNFIISDGKSLYAYRDYNEKEVSDYLYTLKYCVTNDSVVVCSEPLTVHVPEKEWEEIKNKRLLVVEDDMRVKLIQV